MARSEPGAKDEGREWIACKDRLPEEGVVVETKMAEPDRNVALLVRQGILWYFADHSMYVYYTPTHWRPATKKQLADEATRLRRSMAVSSRRADEIERQALHAD